MGGFHLGNVVGLVLTPLVMSSIGISGPFILFSSLGFLWLTTWTSKVANDPQDCSTIKKSELRLIQAGKTDSPATKGKLPPLGLLLSKLPTWAIIFANVTNNWVSIYTHTKIYIYCYAIVLTSVKHDSECRDTLCSSRGCLFISKQ